MIKTTLKIEVRGKIEIPKYFVLDKLFINDEQYLLRFWITKHNIKIFSIHDIRGTKMNFNKDIEQQIENELINVCESE